MTLNGDVSPHPQDPKLLEVRIGRTTDRQQWFITPTPSDSKCPYFMERFIGIGAMNERRAICEKELSLENSVFCHYKKNVNGIPFCQRYWYGPFFEILPEEEPYVQKKEENGNDVYLLDDLKTETIEVTSHKKMIPLSEQKPIDYTVSDAYLNIDPDIPIQRTEFFSKQYDDTHGKRFMINNNKLGWYKFV